MLLSQRDLYRFDEFVLDRKRRTLKRGETSVSLSPKAFEVLTHLVANPGKLVTKEELMHAVWPESFVEECNLAQHISSLRRAFADRADYIVTIPGRGYQFTANVEPAGWTVGGAQVPTDSAQGVVAVEAVRERTKIVVEEEFSQPIRHGPAPSRVFVAFGAVAVAILAVVIGWRMWHPRTYGHAEVVIADLNNETGDGDFDRSLNRMLQIDLQQSPYFSVVGQRREEDTLKRMRQPVDQKVGAPLAREICERLNGQLYVIPTIAKVGRGYTISIEANDCVDGHSVGAAHKEVTSKGDVLKAFAALTIRLRRDCGESRSSLQHFDKPLLNSYTGSLDALKSYSEGTRLAFSGQYADAIALYQHAIDLDPKYAAAYADMGSMYFNMGDAERDRDAMKKAYLLRDTVNDYERFFIEYAYHESVTGDVHAQRDILRQWESTYTADYLPVTALINLDTTLGEYSSAAVDADRALDMATRGNVHNATLYEIAGRAYHHANMPDKLRSVFADAEQSNSEDGPLHGIELEFAAENGDAAGVEREIKWSRGKPEETNLLQIAAMVALAAGQVRHSEDLFEQARSSAQRDKLEDILTDFDDYNVRMLAELGLTQRAKAILKNLPPGDSNLDRAVAEAETGDAAKALEETKRAEAAAPIDVLMRVEYASSVRATVALREGRPDDAITLLAADAPYELRNPTVPYLRGQAYLAGHRPEAAEAEFEKIAGKPWLSEPATPLTALATLGRARAMAKQDQFAASRKQYQNLFNLWKNADKLPILDDARLEYARLP